MPGLQAATCNSVVLVFFILNYSQKWEQYLNFLGHLLVYFSYNYRLTTRILTKENKIAISRSGESFDWPWKSDISYCQYRSSWNLTMCAKKRTFLGKYNLTIAQNSGVWRGIKKHQALWNKKYMTHTHTHIHCICTNTAMY